ncbi:MAG: NfeD family protein [Verrucomicrobiota bacterium]|nr:NfeD family protein [Verrucomicrobiota bacterium]
MNTPIPQRPGPALSARILLLLPLLFVSIAAHAAYAADLNETTTDPATTQPEASQRAQGDAPVLVIPVQGPIEKALVYVLRRGVKEAEQMKASAIILDMDTPGGAVNATEEIIQILLRTEIPTYTYVNPNAYSAGALIAFATEHIYMAPGSRIGAARPVLMSPGSGGGSAPDEGYQEKIDSALAAMARSIAQQRGHNPEVADAMVDIDKELIVNGKHLSEKGKILTLTHIEATQIDESTGRPLLAAGVAADLPALIEQLGLGESPRKTLEVTGAEQIARWIALLSPLLLGAGLLGIYLEFKTPGFGLFGALGILCLLAFFFGHMIAGLAGMEDLVIFFLGCLLLGIELLVLPGFGIAGFAGLLLLLFSLLSAMLESLPGQGMLPPIEFWGQPMFNLTTGILLAIAASFALLQFLPEAGPFKLLVLKSAESSDEGYLSTRSEIYPRPGARGLSTTPLRPVGKARFDHRLVDVSSQGEMIQAGTDVVVVKVEGNQVYVVRA